MENQQLRELARELVNALDREATTSVVNDIINDINGVWMGKLFEAATYAHDEDYERAAVRARANDFEETGGKDWT